MEEKKKLKIIANKKIVTFSLIALALLMLVSTSYAYFTAVITGNDTAKQAKVTTGTMALKLHGNTDLGMSAAMPGDSTTITFSVENTGTLATTYSLNLDQVTNNFVDKNDLVYTITSTNNGGSKTETVIPSTNGILIPVISIEPKVTQEYTMTITFKETGDIQNDNQGKTFTGRVQIETLENSNYLAAKVINSNPTAEDEILEEQWNYTGIVKTLDENGISYVNRGDIKNNYLSFADKTWRIVRVNGNGTIRLILDDSTGESQKFNASSKNHKYVGYTYDNDHVCTKANPCIAETGTNSTIKNYLENEWYADNLSTYDDKIALESYCNDTSNTITDSPKYYIVSDRMDNKAPSLDCNDTKETYGGYYKLKVGMLSVDEMMLAGLSWYLDENITTSYLASDYEWWSFSPYHSTTDSSSVYLGSSNFNYYFSSTPISVRPVINLKADVLISSGNGTKDNPYVIN